MADIMYRITAVIDAIKIDDDGKEVGIVRGVVGPVVQCQLDSLTQAMFSVSFGSDERPDNTELFDMSEKLAAEIEEGKYKWEKIQ